MGGNKFISSEPKSGLSPEEMRNLGDKIDSLKNRIDELNGERLEIKAEMALKNKFISPEQEKELFDLVNSSEDLYKRYHRGERTEDLLAGLENYYQSFMQKRNEIFFDPNFLPKNEKADNPGGEFKGDSPLFRKQARRFRDVKETDEMDMADITEKEADRVRKKSGGKESSGGENEEELKKQLDAAYKNLYGFLNEKKVAPQEAYEELARLEKQLYGVLKNRSKVGEIAEEFKEKYRGKGKSGNKKERRQEEKERRELEENQTKVKLKEKSGFTEQDVARRTADIERRRVEGKQAGFTWAEIDKLLRDKGIEPGTSEAAKFIKNWDQEKAKQEVAAESRKIDRLLERTSDPEYQELMRKFFQIVLNCALKDPDGKELSYDVFKIKDNEELNAKILELAKENMQFAVHGNVGLDEDGNGKVTRSPDMDGLTALYLFQKAGFKHANLKDVVFVKKGETSEGRFNIDTGNVLGFVLEGEGIEEGKTAIADHHLEDKPNYTSASEIIYKILNKLDLLPKYAALRKTVEFVTMLDNKSYLNDPRFDEYFKNYFTGSWKTILGLQGFIRSARNLELIENFFQGEKSAKKSTPRNLIDVCKELDGETLEKLGFIYATQNETKKHEKDPNYEIKKKNLSEVQQKTVEAARQELERLEKAWFIIPSNKYGRIIVDIGGKLKPGIDLTRAYNCGAYILWSPEKKSFFINTLKPLEEKFDQGIGKRGMWLKPVGDEEELTLKLGDVLTKMTDGKFEPTGELAEFLAKEGQEVVGEKKAELSPEVFGILKSAKDEFYQELKKEAEAMEGWGKYNPEQQKTLLGIELETFLRGYIEEECVSRNLVAKEDVAKAVERLMAEKIIETTAPVVLDKRAEEKADVQ